MATGKPRLAGFVALAYTVVIVYASLQPFAGWRMPPGQVLGFLTAPWPRYITAADIALNVAAYLPLGTMLFVALRPPLRAAGALVLATLIATGLSLALESVQMFLPVRIASNVDLLSNGAGAASGALAAWLLTRESTPLMALRARAVRGNALGNCGLILIALWILVQFHPAPLALGSGDLREALGLPPLFAYTPQSYLRAEAGVAAFAVMGISLLVSVLMRPQRYAMPAIALTLLLTLAAKSIAAVTLGRAAQWLQWLTPGVAAGTAGGIVLFALMLRLAPVARAALAIFCIAAGVCIVNATPENPYQAVPVFMLSPQPTHLANFGHIVRALSQLWPLAAVIWLFALLRSERVGAAH
ncbi:MAG: VanZ family protein [Betaproteobacteria bacterium]|nr:VanZ family protein [Betaproteobacteria bacterium]MBI2226612.1 VanZ family protein [Betaproteobacteria bacterium]